MGSPRSDLDGVVAEAMAVAGARLRSVEVIRERPDRGVYRVVTDRGQFVLKVLAGAAQREAAAYRALPAVNLPMPRATVVTTGSLLLEDLAGPASQWRLASADDMHDISAIRAIAAWYRHLHDRAPEAVANLPSLIRESAVITREALSKVTTAYSLRHGWEQRWEDLDAVRRAFDDLPATVLYRDFHWSNVALGPTSAMMFDYHEIGAGPRESDIRNVVTALPPASASAFLDRYGDLDERARVLDAPVATVAALITALDRPSPPQWAWSLADQVRNGTFEELLNRAIQSL